MHEQYSELLKHLREAALLASVGDLLSWDQETMMPAHAGAFRAEQLGLVSGLAHRRATDPRIGELLAACEADVALGSVPEVAANLREIRRDYDRAVKLPSRLVEESSETASLAVEAWKQARERSEFGYFLPWLEKQVRLSRARAECQGAPPGGDLYDALLDDFEPDMTGAQIEAIFSPLRRGLVALLDELVTSGDRPDLALAEIAPPQDQQHDFNRRVLERVGFDVTAGRFDTSTHPFATGIAPGDTRITTRYSQGGFIASLTSTLHEAGHGLYEQGLLKETRFGQPLAEALGLGIHESQSRLWENHVGRSREFWQWAAPEMREIFGSAFARCSAEDLYRAANVIAPSLIRTESDEVTFNLHVMLRFELERAMILGELRPMDLPAAWNERVERDLGLSVPDDRRGCLQDVHWAHGSFGYFPAYTLGNLYASQFWEALLAAVPGVTERIAQGDFQGVLDWLRREIHGHGRRFSAAKLCRQLTGSPLSHEPLLRHLNGKLKPIYGLAATSAR